MHSPGNCWLGAQLSVWAELEPLELLERAKEESILS